ncbi:MAG: ATP-dependent helicase [bacterium]|nr:ATP-dependent helicase [bacterium]
MNDYLVAAALRSDAPLVLVEAPAGCGKTFQAAQYAKDLLPKLSPGRLLILTHTNAACDVFKDRTIGFGNRVEIRTIDSLITQIATAYHRALDLPHDVPAWARQHGPGGFSELAVKVANLLARSAVISASLASRYPYVICDEHQDSSEAQHQIILSIHHVGAITRIFGDPMQAIYERRQDRDAWDRRWAELQTAAHQRVELNTPHRWQDRAPELGAWISEARSALKNERRIDLRGELPHGLALIRADNTAERHGQYLCKNDRKPIDSFVRTASELLVLAATNDMVRGLRAFFYRRIPIWEGHRRDALASLILACQQDIGNAVAIGNAYIEFVQSVARGFSDTAYGKILRREVAEKCSSRRRQKPAKIQELARFIVDCPDHRGAARALAKLGDFIWVDKVFEDVKIDLSREFREAATLVHFEDADAGMAQLTLRRTVLGSSLPPKVISTVHKAKGLETANVMIVPCDRQHFAATDYKRRLLYVALSRATKALALVLPRDSPSPLFLA